MYSKVVEELPLLRSKQRPTEGIGATGPTVGPGSYNVDVSYKQNNSQAPFSSTGTRKPIYDTDPSVPGPGAYNYDVDNDLNKKNGISAIPFVSTSSRFPQERNTEGPGPGTYGNYDTWPTKSSTRSHKFSSSPQRELLEVGGDDRSGPGYYEPNYEAVARKNPAASHFSKYSGRNDLGPKKDVPGPGSYNYDSKGRSIYDSKPSSMFATKTERAPLETKDTPGPGTYNLAPKGRTIPREAFSAFGSTSSRFNPQYDETPGPGSYTGEIAPRRVKPQYGKGTAPFVSNSDRFSSKNGGPPGPGAYDGSLLPTHVPFGANTPFHSTVPRFGPVSNRALPLKFDEYAFEDTDPALYPRQKYISKRPFVNREIQPTLGPEILPERSYNINYDGYRPEGSTRGTLGHAPRMGGGASQRQAYSAPGPGTYDPRGATSYRHANSNWSQDPRFKVAGQPIGGDDIGRTYYESTFLTKSHNVTIGSDTMWMRN